MVYTVVRAAMMSELETVALSNRQKAELQEEEVKMKMLRSLLGMILFIR